MQWINSIRNAVIALIWIGFTVYIVYLAPLDQPETVSILKNLLTFQLSEVNAYLVAIFWMMGVWPMIYACLMFADGRMQKLPAFLYFIVSNGIGIVGLAPYLVLRRRSNTFLGKKDWWLQCLDSHLMGIFLSLITVILLGYALSIGNWQAFVFQWHSIPFVHLISLDFCLMGLLFPLSPLLDDDMVRRGIKDARLWWIIAMLPLLGPLTYLCLRPQLEELPIQKSSL